MEGFDSVMLVREFLDMSDSNGVTDVEPAMLENMTLEQIRDAIERLTAIEPTMEEGKNNLKVEHKEEFDKLQAEHQRKMKSVLDRHVEENNEYGNYCTEKKKQKQVLQAELRQRLQAAETAQP